MADGSGKPIVKEAEAAAAEAAREARAEVLDRPPGKKPAGASRAVASHVSMSLCGAFAATTIAAG